MDNIFRSITMLRRRSLRNCAFMLIGLLSFHGCCAQQESIEACRMKVSATLLSVLEQSQTPDVPLEIVATLSDSSGILLRFPTLQLPNPNIALGHLTKEEIFSLCAQDGVISIDKPKMFFPKQ